MRAVAVGFAAALVGAVLLQVAPAEAANPTWRVFATREGLVGETTANGHVIQSRDHFVALPSRTALSCNGCFDKQVKVCYAKTGRCETAPAWDVGPWNTKDNWWDPSSQRELFKDLPQGTPEAEAAYFDNYNGGKDMFGREVLNPAGIDLADGTFWDGLGMTGNDWVDVTFLWIQVSAFTVTIQKPAANAWVRGTTTAQGTSNQESNLHWMRFFVDGALAKWVTPAPHAWSWDTSGWSDGSHALKLEGENLQGARDVHQVTIRIDNTPPRTTAAAAGTPGTNGWFRSAVTVTLSATDAGSGVAVTKRSLDGAAFFTGTPLHVAGDAVHSVRYFSQDVAGNVEPTRTLVVKVDATPPTVRLADPMPGNAYVDDREDPFPPALPDTVVAGTKTVRADAGDATSGVARVEFRVDGILRATDAAAPYEFAWAAGDEAGGDHRLEVRAVDAAGNAAAAAPLPVKTVPSTPQGLERTLDGAL